MGNPLCFIVFFQFKFLLRYKSHSWRCLWFQRLTVCQRRCAMITINIFLSLDLLQPDGVNFWNSLKYHRSMKLGWKVIGRRKKGQKKKLDLVKLQFLALCRVESVHSVHVAYLRSRYEKPTCGEGWILNPTFEAR